MEKQLNEETTLSFKSKILDFVIIAIQTKNCPYVLNLVEQESCYIFQGLYLEDWAKYIEKYGILILMNSNYFYEYLFKEQK